MKLKQYILEWEKPSVRVAREIDEPAFIKSIMTAYPDVVAKQGTKEDDFNHIDVFVDWPDEKWLVDVKSVEQNNSKTGNYSLTLKNQKDQWLRLKSAKDMYLAFVDWGTGNIYTISKPDFYEMTKYYKRREGRNNTIYILIPRKDLEKNPNTLIIPIVK